MKTIRIYGASDDLIEVEGTGVGWLYQVGPGRSRCGRRLPP